jgi:hypothetical protein
VGGEVGHDAASIHESVAGGVAGQLGVADDGAGGVEAHGVAVVAAEGAEVGLHAAGVEKGVVIAEHGGRGAGVGVSGDLAGGVDGVGVTPRAAEGAEVGHGAADVGKGVGAADGRRRIACDQARGVDRGWRR